MPSSDIRVFTAGSAEGVTTFKRTWRTKLFLIVALGCVGVVVAFIGGFFAGRQNLGSSPPITVELADLTAPTLPTEASWKEAVCTNTKSQCPPSFKRNPLILLSMDGFAAEYLKLRLNPTLEQLMRCGVHPPYMNPVFPSKTFPNHYSIVTGLFPSSHGIIDNSMYDPILNKYFSLRSPEATKKEWWDGEPIWVTAKKQGLKTATYFWPGSDVTGQKADYYVPYNKTDRPFVNRIRQIFRWLDKPQESRPDFITVYFEEPDISGHKYGPQSENVKEALKKVDYLIDLLLEGLYHRKLIGCVNLIIVSDHGMESISCDRVLSLPHLNPHFNSTDMYVRDGTIGRLRPLKNSSKELLDEIQNQFQCKSPQLWVYQQHEFPVRWRYEGHHRIDPILFDTQPQWLITDKHLSSRKDLNPRDCVGGEHGYDNVDEDMWSIFIAVGPAFKTNLLVEPFLNVQIYNLMAVLLGVSPSPNNGTFGSLFHLLKNPPPYPHDDIDKDIFVCGLNHSFNNNLTQCLTDMRVMGETDVGNATQLAPWGFPIDINKDADRKICLLGNSHFIVGYSQALYLPAWTIHNILPETKLELFLNESVNVTNLNQCYSHINVSDKSELIFTPLIFTDNWQNSNLEITTMPVYKKFFFDVLQPLLIKIETWRIRFPYIHLISGPAWQKNSDLEKAVIPSYFYFIITFCDEGNWESRDFNCTVDNLNAFGFVLPHIKKLPACWDYNKYLEKHQASVDVIEHITGLKFFVDLPQDVSLKLRLRLFQTSSLSFSSETKNKHI